MSTSNIDRFDHLVGVIFAKLYATFPLGQDFNSHAFDEEILVDDEDITFDKDGQPYAGDQLMNRSDFFVATLKWLIGAQYVSAQKEISGMDGHDFLGCTLTTKALEVLKVKVDSLSGKSIGDQLQDAAKAGLMDSMKNLTGKALSIGAKMSFSAAATWVAS